MSSKRVKSKLNRFFASLILLSALFLAAPAVSGDGNAILEIENLELNSPEVRSIREDIRKTIRTIMGGHSADQLPELKIYSYRPGKDDTFWSILSKTSLDMDTLLTVNALLSPAEIQNRRVIYIPNMRGVAVEGEEKDRIESLMSGGDIDPEYVKRVNRSEDLSKEYIFIPGGTITSLERSLFLGTAFMYPVRDGRKSSGFGSRVNPFDRRQREFHTGIDIAVPVNTAVYASRGGVVEFSGYRGGYGLLVIIKHEHGYRTYYGHLNRSQVKKGERVYANQQIAVSGNTGRTTGPHIHFEIRKDNRPVNPSQLLRR